MFDAGVNIAKIDFCEKNQKTSAQILSNIQTALKMRPKHRCEVMLNVMDPVQAAVLNG